MFHRLFCQLQVDLLIPFNVTVSAQLKSAGISFSLTRVIIAAVSTIIFTDWSFNVPFTIKLLPVVRLITKSDEAGGPKSGMAIDACSWPLRFRTGRWPSGSIRWCLNPYSYLTGCSYGHFLVMGTAVGSN